MLPNQHTYTFSKGISYATYPTYIHTIERYFSCYLSNVYTLLKGILLMLPTQHMYTLSKGIFHAT